MRSDLSTYRHQVARAIALILGLAILCTFPARAVSAVEPLEAAPVNDAGVRPNPFRAGSAWTGHYTCAQGLTELTLRVTTTAGNRVSAIFEFNHRPGGVHGSYSVSGEFDPRDGRISMTPVAWIEQPTGYVMVPLVGRVTSDSRYAGTVPFQGCTTFEVISR